MSLDRIFIKQEINDTSEIVNFIKQEEIKIEEIPVKEEILEEDNSFLCEICGNGLRTLSALENHEAAHKIISYTCETCNAKFRQKKDLEDHIPVHNTIQPYPCTLCTKIFQTEFYLQLHKARMHSENATNVPVADGNNLFRCEMCEKMFKSVAALDNHKFVHSMILHECDICNAKFRRRKDLDGHLTLHDHYKEYFCTFCTKIFKTEFYLKRHRYACTLAKWWVKVFLRCDLIFLLYAYIFWVLQEKRDGKKCLVCSKKFFYKYDFKRHVKTHTNERSYLCVMCNKKFKTADCLRVHSSKVHGKKRICGEVAEKHD